MAAAYKKKYGDTTPDSREEYARRGRFLQGRGFARGANPGFSRPIEEAQERRLAQRYGDHEQRGIAQPIFGVFPRARPRTGGVQPARAGQRSDVAVHQRRHGAVQGRVPRPRAAQL
ncbi:hypothetical protein [Methylogaea oryzae]|uniref:hypothetical protein n=1 Tax=Methylogaea oryzae TaxID=1295382 RepID=UPI0035716C12